MFTLRYTEKFLRRLVKKLVLGSIVFTFLWLTFLLIKRFNIFPVNPVHSSILFALCLALVFLYHPLERYLNALTRKLILRKKEQGILNLHSFPDALLTLIDLKELANFLVNTLGECLNLGSCSLLVWSERTQRFVAASTYGLSVPQALRCELQPQDFLVSLLKQHRSFVDREVVIPGLTWQEANDLERNFELLKASLALPLFGTDGQLIGIICVCKRFKPYIWREEEVQFFNGLIRHAAIALSNALRYETLRAELGELREQQSHLLQSTKLRTLEQLAGGIAHEIHNPLTIISGRAQILLLRKASSFDPRRVEEVLRTIVAQTNRAAEITRKLLLFSQESQGKKEWLSIESVIDDTIALLSYQMSLDEIQIKKRIENSLPLFRADVTELRELFLNLLLNATQAIGKQGTITILVRYREAEQRWEIKIADTGCGIPAENIPKLFDPFFTTRREAVGLGLYVIQQILKRYGGSIQIESEFGKGTVAKIELPQPLEAPPQELVTAGVRKGAKVVTSAPSR